MSVRHKAPSNWPSLDRKVRALSESATETPPVPSDTHEVETQSRDQQRDTQERQGDD